MHRGLELDEPQVFESEGMMDLEEPQQPNPQEELVYIPLAQDRSSLTPKARLNLLMQELSQINADLCEEKPSTEKPPRYYSSLLNTTQQAEDLMRNEGHKIQGDLGIGSNVSRKLGHSLLKLLPISKAGTLELSEPYPEEYQEGQNRDLAVVANLSSRIAKLEEMLGVWEPKHGYYNIVQSLTSIKKRIQGLNPKKIEALNTQAEDVNAELDMVKNQLEMLQSASSEQKAIDELYELLGIVQEVAPALPPIIERLEAVKKVHDEGARFNERVHEIKNRQAKIEQKLKELNSQEMVEEWNAFKQQVASRFQEFENKFKR